MSAVHFVDDVDKTTFFPFELTDARDSEWSDVRLSFSEWAWFKDKYKTDEINEYYFNGYGVQGLVLASRVAAGLEVEPDGMHANSEGDTCYIHFKQLDMAIETAALACAMINDRALIEKAIIVARENDLDDC